MRIQYRCFRTCFVFASWGCIKMCIHKSISELKMHMKTELLCENRRIILNICFLYWCTGIRLRYRQAVFTLFSSLFFKYLLVPPYLQIRYTWYLHICDDLGIYRTNHHGEFPTGFCTKQHVLPLKHVDLSICVLCIYKIHCADLVYRANAASAASSHHPDLRRCIHTDP